VPQRFSELRHALPNASSNLLADRLRELEHNGVIRRRRQAGTQLYELTEWGRKLEPIALALSEWGIEAPQPPEPTSLSATSVLIFLRVGLHPSPMARPIACRLDLDGSVWTVRVESGQVHVASGEPTTADISLRTDPKTLGNLFAEPTTLDALLADGSVAFVGDRSALEQLLYGVGETAQP
jgi:hypothetical protein